MTKSELTLILNDFPTYLAYTWKLLNLPPPTEAQIILAKALQSDTEKIQVIAFRGLGKSWATSAFVDWELLRDNQKEILITSAGSRLAIEVSTFCKRMISEFPILRHLKPRSDQFKSNEFWDCNGKKPSKSPSVKSAGITGQITGSRSDIIVSDDVETPENSDSEKKRTSIRTKIKEYSSIKKPHSRIIFLGTFHSTESIYHENMEKGYKTTIIPCEYISSEDNAKYYRGQCVPEFVDDTRIGEPSDPSRFDAEELADKKLEMGLSTYAMQMLIRTDLGNELKNPLKTHELIMMDIDSMKAPSFVSYSSDIETRLDRLEIPFVPARYAPHKPSYLSNEFEEYERKLMVIDPSGEGDDETAYVILGQLNSKLFLIDYGGVFGGYGDVALEKLARKASHHKVHEVQVEDNFGDGMFRKLFQPILFRFIHCGLDGFKESKNKENRIIDRLEPILNQHRLVININPAMNDTRGRDYNLLYQLSKITRTQGVLKHDDKLDALASAVKILEDGLSKDDEIEYNKNKEQILQDRLDYLEELAEATGNVFSFN